MKKDLHWIDNVLIRSGWIMLAVLLTLGSLVALASGSVWGGVVWAGGVLAAIAAIVAGMVIRAKENRVIAMWSILENAVEVPVRDLEQNTGFDRAFIEESLRLINNQGLGYFVWDRKSDTIVDGRLRTTLITVASCPACGAQSVVPRCDYCDRAVSVAHLNRLKTELINQIRPDAHLVPMQRAEEQAPDFNIILFALLFLTCSPLGIVYAVWKSGVLGKINVQWDV